MFCACLIDYKYVCRKTYVHISQCTKQHSWYQAISVCTYFIQGWNYCLKENVHFVHANSNIQQNNSCQRLFTVVSMPLMHSVTLLQSVNRVLTNCASISTLPKEVDQTFSNTPLPNIKTRCRIKLIYYAIHILLPVFVVKIHDPTIGNYLI